MGCFMSKVNDNKNENDARSRNQASSSQSTSSSAQTPSKQINIQPKEEENQQEVSYSQMRELDNDYFKDIIDRTAQKFIDVSMVGPDGKDPFDKEKDYSSQIKESKIHKPVALTALPRLSQHCQTSNLHNLLSQPTNFDSELMNRYSNSILESLNNIHVKDCGELVVFFGNSLKQ
ncbi:hypothetical protein DICPUDRAFT_88812 [Dictyostelium purpureum]|uniref:Uncharacterized protein n=1 Tax=Dictyostelium purpureum TaxID=5786 RepID=F0ZRS7_DICPU|nr:uncharacterized protein DICPUDRAFT_88812 [Dictyostelium purpureum]EGC33371.1 hypothetical protein DICPUDRAFT_88812 [Dictyostelium purpureum]|eukprot:XP_003290122.1 hypothetical protein DICPUDRAFT_88812 [Dictyostelium purpureum]